MVTLHDAICDKLQAIRPGAQWTFAGTEYSGLTWLDAVQSKPTIEELGL